MAIIGEGHPLLIKAPRAQKRNTRRKGVISTRTVGLNMPAGGLGGPPRLYGSVDKEGEGRHWMYGETRLKEPTQPGSIVQATWSGALWWLIRHSLVLQRLFRHFGEGRDSRSQRLLTGFCDSNRLLINRIVLTQPMGKCDLTVATHFIDILQATARSNNRICLDDA